MTFNQWWSSLKWSFIMRILVEPLAKLFSEIAWNAAVRAEREACAKLCDELQDYPTVEARHCAEEIRARGQACT
jgi:hypothetical protein